MAESPSTPNVVDYLTLAAAIIAPAVAAATTIYQVRRGERDKISVHLEWAMVETDEMIGEMPFLHVHNRSQHKILVTDIRFAIGALLKRGLRNTAKWYDDPFDLDFPYQVDPGEVRRFLLSEDEAERVFEKYKWKVRAWGWLRLRYVRLEVRTAGGAIRRVQGERALPYSKRPDWTVRDDN